MTITEMKSFLIKFLTSLLTEDHLFSKSCLILLLIMVIGIWFKCRMRFYDDNVEEIINYYKIQNKFDKIITIVSFFVFSLMFISIILFLWASNIEKMLNPVEVYNNTLNHLLNVNLISSILNISLILVLLSIYLCFMLSVVRYIKRCIIKIHLYYLDDKNTFYGHYIRKIFVNYFTYDNIFHHISDVSFKCLKRELRVFGFPFEYHFITILPRIHYVILFWYLLYDIRMNSCVLQQFYAILPYILLYDLYIRASNFYHYLDILYNADQYLHSMMYSDNTEMFNDEGIYLDKKYIDFVTLQKFIVIYLKNDLNGLLLDKNLDNTYENYLFSYNYFKDWKKRYKKNDGIKN